MSSREPSAEGESQGTADDPSVSQPPWTPRARGSVDAARPRRDPASVLATSSFSAGVLLLPRELQADARSLYYLLRTIDDLVDERVPYASERVEALEAWASGSPAASPETNTLAELSTRYPMPRQALADFCKGMRLDLEEAEIKTETDLERYCEYAGGTVGVMLTALLGATNPAAERKMLVLGTAMQRTNIIRDIDEDLERGRVYIASSTIAHYGFPHPGRREQLLRDQIMRADQLFAEGLEAIPMLRRGARAMGISAELYREILRQVEREGFGRSPGRVRIPNWRKQLVVSRYRRPSS